MIAFLALAAALAADPCALPFPAPVAGPVAGSEEARLYTGVGDAESAAGSPSTAATAYRRALELDPGDAAARAGLERACRALRADVDAALALVRQGHPEEAVARLQEFRQKRDTPAAALLAGTQLYLLNRDAEARAALEAVPAQAPEADAARLYLGLLDLRENRVAEARLAFEAAEESPDPELAALGRRWLAEAIRSSPWTGAVSLDAGYNSNVALSPEDSLQPQGGDGLALVAATLGWRPLPGSGPYARVAGSYRAHASMRPFDFGSAAARAGARWGNAAQHLLGEYEYEFVGLGGSPYLSSHQLRGEGRLSSGPFALAASGALRFESYLQSPADLYSGTRAEGAVDASAGFLRRFVFGVGGRLARQWATTASRSLVEEGPVASLSCDFDGRTFLRVDGSLLLRRYDDVDLTLGGARDANVWGVRASLAHQLTPAWTLRLEGSYRKVAASLSTLTYHRATALAGATYTFGF